MSKQKKAKTTEPNYWLWVTRPEYYLDEDGNDRWDEDYIEYEAEADGWWSCHKDTRAGDLILLWRTSPKIDIGYLIQATSDAFSLSKDEYAVDAGWGYGCEYLPLYKFNDPVTKKDIDKVPRLTEWGAYRGRFQRSVFRIPPEHWERLKKLLINKNPDYKTFLKEETLSAVPMRVTLEEDLENYLETDLSLLHPCGFDVSLYNNVKTGKTGRQYICGETRGRIDLLCVDNDDGSFLVIELKINKATDQTFAQVARYMGYVQIRLAKGKEVHGLVISDGYDLNFEMASQTNDKVHHLDLKDIGFKK